MGDVAFDVDAADVEQAPQSNEEGRLYVDVEERERGNAGPFFALYRDPELERRYGWYCASCGSIETAMDPMGRVTCGECDNTRQPTRWDAAYL